MPWRVASNGISTPAECSFQKFPRTSLFLMYRWRPRLTSRSIFARQLLHHHPEPEIFLQAIPSLVHTSNHSSDVPVPLPPPPRIRPRGYEIRKFVLTNAWMRPKTPGYDYITLYTEYSNEIGELLRASRSSSGQAKRSKAKRIEWVRTREVM